MKVKMFDEKARRTGFVTEYGAEEKFAAAIAAHDDKWYDHKALCAEQTLERLQEKGVTEDEKMLKRELERLAKGIATTAYHNDGWLNERQLENSQYRIVIDMLVYRALCIIAH